MVIRTIKLTSLFVNTENYRFEPLSSQKEAIDKMIEDQGDKLYSLVDDIVTNGLPRRFDYCNTQRRQQ